MKDGVCFKLRRSSVAIEPQVYIPGGTLIFSYIHRLGPFLGVPNFEFQYFFWGEGVQKI